MKSKSQKKFKFSTKEEVSYALIENPIGRLKSYKDAYDAYQNREGNKLCLIQNIQHKKVIMILNTKIISVKWAIACASRVLHIFEKIYPDDLRPRQAIESATRWLNSPTETNRMAAKAAAKASTRASTRASTDAARNRLPTNAAALAAYASEATANAAYTANAEAWVAGVAYWAARAVAANAADDARSKEIVWQRRCLQSIVDRSIAILYLLKMQQNPKTTLPLDLQKLVRNFI